MKGDADQQGLVLKRIEKSKEKFNDLLQGMFKNEE